MKFKLDENLPSEFAELFRQAGFDAATVLEQGLGGSTDSHLISVCKSEGRVFVTLDRGFADLRSYPPQEHCGLIVLRLQRQDTPHILTVGQGLLHHLNRSSPLGHLWVVEETQIRVR